MWLRILTSSVIFLGVILSGNAQTTIRYCVNVNGMWNAWQTSNLSGGFYGNYSGFHIFDEPNKPWGDIHFSFQIHGYVEPSDEVKKQHRRNKEWFQYNGTVEYWVCDEYPTIKDVLSKFGWPAICPTRGTIRRVKRTANAVIRIEPYKKHPRVYNFIFDDVAFAIDLEFDRW